MKRGSFVGARKPMSKVSDKVKAGQAEYDAVYAEVDARSGGRCEVIFTGDDVFHLARQYTGLTLVALETWRCVARAVEHHHTMTPRRSHHSAEKIQHICRRHHDMVTASYKVGRLLTEPNGDGTFTCRIEQKEGKWPR